MAKRKLTVKSRSTFAFSKSLGALKWMVVSGVATYSLLELSKVLGALQLDKGYSAVVMLVINTLLFAIAKYVEGEEK